MLDCCFDCRVESTSDSTSDSDTATTPSNPMISNRITPASIALNPSNSTCPLQSSTSSSQSSGTSDSSKSPKASKDPLEITLSPASPNPSNAPEVVVMASQEASVIAEKRQDFVSIVLDGLLGLQNTLARTMHDLIAILAKTENASVMMQVLREQIRQRKEFERVSQLTIYMQCNTYKAMAQCLELGFFQVTDKVAANVVMEAAKSIPHINNCEALIRNCTPYDCRKKERKE